MAYEYTRMVIETGVDYTLVIEVCPVASLP